jgi:hypothetical protein
MRTLRLRRRQGQLRALAQPARRERHADRAARHRECPGAPA